jgi:hypothetical protein
VVELAASVARPHARLIVRVLGARVITVERPSGGEEAHGRARHLHPAASGSHSAKPQGLADCGVDEVEIRGLMESGAVGGALLRSLARLFRVSLRPCARGVTLMAHGAGTNPMPIGQHGIFGFETGSCAALGRPRSVHRVLETMTSDIPYLGCEKVRIKNDSTREGSNR